MWPNMENHTFSAESKSCKAFGGKAKGNCRLRLENSIQKRRQQRIVFLAVKGDVLKANPV